MADEELSELDDLWRDYMFDHSPAGEMAWWEEYTDVYDAAEHFVVENDEEGLRGSAAEIDALLALPTEQDRRAAIRYPLRDIEDDEGAFDTLLLALRARIERQLAGDDSRPLVDPRGPRPPRKSAPVSPQGYDVSLPSAGSFHNAQVAEAVVDAVLKAYGDLGVVEAAR